MARSDLVIMREKFVGVVVENQSLRKELDEKDEQLAAANGRIEELEAKLVEDQAGHAAEIKRREAVHAAEIGERDERIRMLEAGNAALAADNKRLAASDACHNSPHSPPRTGTWTAEYHRKKAIEARYARQPDWRPPGRAVGHPGATRKLETNRPDEHRRPFECGRCHGRNLSDLHTFAKQVVDIEKIIVSRRSLVMHDMVCNDCGARVDAPRDGTLRKTWASPRTAALIWNIRYDTYCSLGMLAKVGGRLLGIPMTRATAAAIVDAANDALAWPASMIRQDMDALRDYGEMDECVHKMMVRDGDAEAEREEAEAGRRMEERRASGEMSGGAGAAGAAALPVAWRLGHAQPGDAGAGAGKGRGKKGGSGGGGGGRRKVRRGYIHRAQDSGGNVNVWAVPSRGLAVLKNRFPDRVGAGTSADGLPNYDHCSARQRDHAHEVRETEKAAMTGDPAAAVLHERFSGTLAEVRACAAGHTGGAFPDPTMGDKAAAYKARILGIAEGFDKAGFRRVANRIRGAADGTVECIIRPGLTATTHKSEQGMREFVRDRGSSPMLVSAPGRRRYSDGKGCRNTWLNKGLDPFHEMGAALGVKPGREWAQVRAEGERAGARGAPGRGAMPAGWSRPSGAHPARPDPAVPPEAADARMPTACGAGKARRGGGGAAPQSAPRKSQRRLAASAAPGKAAPGKAAPGKAAKSLPDVQPPHPATARAAPAAAPSGPGPPPAGGPRNPVAAA